MKIHTSPIQIRFADIDKLGHVNNAVYLSYFEQARTIFFKDVFKESLDWSKKGLILAKAEVNFLQPVFLEDEISVETYCTHIGNKSFTLSYRLLKGGSVEAANSTSVLVCFDYEKRASIEVPADWRNILTEFLNMNMPNNQV